MGHEREWDRRPEGVHVADFRDRAFRLLPSLEEFLTKGLAGLVLQSPSIRTDESLRLSCEDLAVADICTERVKVAIFETSFALDEHVDCLGPVGLHGGHSLLQHCLGLVCRSELTLGECRTEQSDRETRKCAEQDFAR